MLRLGKKQQLFFRMRAIKRDVKRCKLLFNQLYERTHKGIYKNLTGLSK